MCKRSISIGQVAHSYPPVRTMSAEGDERLVLEPGPHPRTQYETDPPWIDH